MKFFPLALVATLLLAIGSLFVGVTDISLSTLMADTGESSAQAVLVASRIPRTIALFLAGCGMAVCGVIMQIIMRNRFVEPSTAGTVEAARLGILGVLLLAPDMPILLRMLVVAACAMAGTLLLLGILQRVPLRSPVMVPLLGIMLGAILSSVATFIAYRYDLTQAIMAWTSGDFSMVLRGRYEILWLSAALVVLAYLMADQFTIAGLGESFAVNLGLNYRRAVYCGLGVVAMVTASVVVTVGIVPFVGLIVPNVVSLIAGDHLRRTLPWTALCGSALLLVCDIFGRMINPPFEIPVGTVLGILGGVFFLFLLVRRPPGVA